MDAQDEQDKAIQEILFIHVEFFLIVLVS